MKRVFLLLLVAVFVGVLVLPTYAADNPNKIGYPYAGDVNLSAADKDAATKAIQAEYNAQKAAGFNCGEPDPGMFGTVHNWDGTIVQNYINSDYAPVNYKDWFPRLCLIFVIKIEGEWKAFTVKCQMIDAYVAAGQASICGAPIGNQFEKDNKIYQNFQYGSIQIDGNNYRWRRRVKEPEPAPVQG